MEPIVAQLLSVDDPCLRYRTRVRVLGEDPTSTGLRRLAAQVRRSERVTRLLAGAEACGRHVYSKYCGAHWALAMLADLGYPPGDRRLMPLRDRVYECWLASAHVAERVLEGETPRYKSRPGVPIIDGRARRCASQEGNALWSTLALGIADERADQLAANLVRWQWPDGGWNCDRKACATHSSFMESLIPLRALALHGRLRACPFSQAAADRAAEVFLGRRLFRRVTDGSVIREDFTKLHYPCYWQYDVLFGLKVLGEAGKLDDPRCGEALDLLAAKRLPDGGFAAEGRHYNVVERPRPGGSLVAWGSARRGRSNEWVTCEALSVLRLADRPMDISATGPNAR
ncbi:MAG: hypothetical protein AB1505_16075 [Candidatus Latescibacterota bacterium]